MHYDPSRYYVLVRKGGKKILVTPENKHEYSNAVEFIRLDELVPADTPDPIEKAMRKPLTQEQKDKKAAAAREKRAEQKAVAGG